MTDMERIKSGELEGDVHERARMRSSPRNTNLTLSPSPTFRSDDPRSFPPTSPQAKGMKESPRRALSDTYHPLSEAPDTPEGPPKRITFPSSASAFEPSSTALEAPPQARRHPQLFHSPLAPIAWGWRDGGCETAAPSALGRQQ